MENRYFFPQAALDAWIVEGLVDFQNGELLVSGEDRRYELSEAVRIVREVSGSGDRYGLVGRVKPRAHLEQVGAEIVESSMLLGETAYDVDPGWTGVPAGGPGAGPGSLPDAEILAALLRKSS